MAKFYTKNEAGEYEEADALVEEGYREQSDKIVRKKLAQEREKVEARIRNEIEKSVREESESKIKGELRSEVEEQYKQKLTESESKAKQLDIALRRKTIAAEYGFKPEVETFLGDGDDDDMRAKADILKDSISLGIKAPEKKTTIEDSATVKRTGVRVSI